MLKTAGGSHHYGKCHPLLKSVSITSSVQWKNVAEQTFDGQYSETPSDSHSSCGVPT
jgi:hypothetical protein